jgi:hypothetical protein
MSVIKSWRFGGREWQPKKTVWRMAKWLGKCERLCSLFEGEVEVVWWSEEVVVVPDLGKES